MKCVENELFPLPVWIKSLGKWLVHRVTNVDVPKPHLGHLLYIVCVSHWSIERRSKKVICGLARSQQVIVALQWPAHPSQPWQ